MSIIEEYRQQVEQHRMYKRITMLEGNSVSDEISEAVKKHVCGKQRVMVALDSNHTHEHVLAELELYSQFVTKGSYLIVFDTVVNEVDERHFENRPWDAHNNPKTALDKFLKGTTRFEVDASISSKLQISACPGGYLKCVAE